MAAIPLNTLNLKNTQDKVTRYLLTYLVPETFFFCLLSKIKYKRP